MAKYPISNYNKYVCLKADSLMLIITLYLLKPYILEVISIANRKDRSAIINMFYAEKLFLSLEAAAAIPLLFLVYAWTRRVPGASKLTQKIWSKGKYLIIVTAFLQLCITSSPLWLPIDNSMTPTSWIQSFLYLSIMIITPLSRYMKDCFSDFPELSQNNK